MSLERLYFFFFLMYKTCDVESKSDSSEALCALFPIQMWFVHVVLIEHKPVDLRVLAEGVE